ncbi:uncharacterized protein Bfra_008624 [Botrytis fragariae]|uniref:Uncharacterized protein n=1 Tax=Botrytis fragariae TaxID=1964551 RepID=A0A8H6APV0_9HELO|nr:uncharacterized protein Bfra_008624 [Botrytis fragariae]KAF5871601.1 hypothetical protein Bfra_008624 [Botrytis fragariae]
MTLRTVSSYSSTRLITLSVNVSWWFTVPVSIHKVSWVYLDPVIYRSIWSKTEGTAIAQHGHSSPTRGGAMDTMVCQQPYIVSEVF